MNCEEHYANIFSLVVRNRGWVKVLKLNTYLATQRYARTEIRVGCRLSSASPFIYPYHCHVLLHLFRWTIHGSYSSSPCV